MGSSSHQGFILGFSLTEFPALFANSILSFSHCLLSHPCGYCDPTSQTASKTLLISGVPQLASAPSTLSPAPNLRGQLTKNIQVWVAFPAAAAPSA